MLRIRLRSTTEVRRFSGLLVGHSIGAVGGLSPSLSGLYRCIVYLDKKVFSTLSLSSQMYKCMGTGNLAKSCGSCSLQASSGTCFRVSHECLGGRAAILRAGGANFSLPHSSRRLYLLTNRGSYSRETPNK